MQSKSAPVQIVHEGQRLKNSHFPALLFFGRETDFLCPDIREVVFLRRKFDGWEVFFSLTVI